MVSGVVNSRILNRDAKGSGRTRFKSDSYTEFQELPDDPDLLKKIECFHGLIPERRADPSSIKWNIVRPCSIQLNPGYSRKMITGLGVTRETNVLNKFFKASHTLGTGTISRIGRTGIDRGGAGA
ncbi:uncharacterized protein LOC108625756 isoform X2 [Ceratina calcarata]|nr:uncharacterized protein LOC108625756 isoform X2 [Ceratina calcarata]